MDCLIHGKYTDGRSPKMLIFFNALRTNIKYHVKATAATGANFSFIRGNLTHAVLAQKIFFEQFFPAIRAYFRQKVINQILQ